jgi:two-component system, cell cycle sensor histidine kinase and response regulator CckA
VGAVVTNFRDVTERKLALDALRISEARYRRIIETTTEGVWMIDADSRTTFVNQRMAEMLGGTVEEMLGRTPAEFLDEKGSAAIADLTERAEGAVEQLELKFRRKDGGELWGLLEASPIRNDEGGYEGALAMVMDVTERRRAQEALRASESRFRRLWDSGIILITVSDRQGNIIDINEAGVRMLGYSRAEELISHVRWPELTPREWSAADEKALKQLELGGVAQPWEKELLRRDGTRVPILAGAALLDDATGIAIAIDLSEGKRIEAALRQTEMQLRQAQKMEAVGRLAGGIAHDFNNVLSVILSYADLLVAELRSTDPLRDDILEIKKAAARAAGLTRQLLMFSRQQVLEPRVVDLNDMLVSMESMLQRVLGEDVELTIVPSSSIGRVKVDPTGIEQVLMNLVVNSRDAMPTGGKLTIETADVFLDEDYAREHVGVKVGPHVMLAVTDSGSGMDKATQARIFEPFFTTKEIGKGTGLGLSTVFGIVQQSGGTIWVYSEPGRGTTIKVFLPLTELQLEAERPKAVPGSLAGSETILVIEDEDQVRAVAGNILRRRGYRVIEASNAGEALLACERHGGTIHLLLTDVVMPQMSGLELAKRLLQVRPELKVIFMSGYTDDSIVRHGVLASDVSYLQKPLTPAALAAKVRQVLDAR